MCIRDSVGAGLTGHLDGDVAEPAVPLGAVPVLDLRRDDDDSAGLQADRLFADVYKRQGKNMKKLLALLLTLVMCLSLAACGGSGTDTSGTDTSSGETGEDSGNSSYRVAMICDSSISDGGWGMSCYNAMVDAAAERGWATEVSDSIAQSAYYLSLIHI